MTVLTVYRNINLEYLKEGYDPFKNNSELHLNRLRSNTINETAFNLGANNIAGSVSRSLRNELEKGYTIEKGFRL